MDENNRLMMQLASFLINESRQQHAGMGQGQSSMQTGLNVVDLARQLLAGEDTRHGMQEQNTNQMLMVQLARQMLANVGGSCGMGSQSLHPHQNQGDGFTVDRQQSMIASSVHEVSPSPESIPSNRRNSSEGRVFVYQQNPNRPFQPQNSGAQDFSLSVPNSHPSPSGPQSKEAIHQPIHGFCNQQRVLVHNMAENRPRPTVPRVLRPGIDNFSRFTGVANPSMVMHAMQLLKRKDRRKRGPKEKETFPVFLYCLPDKNSKLPKFSSLDPVERSLVDQHQKEGFGYPAQDYIDSIPRKTQLCLSYTADKFHNFMVAIFPKLDGKCYDLYRIDKTRRLIRIEVRTPRDLKDLKYQGSVIIIPYNTDEERPNPIIHRNFDDCYITSAHFGMNMNFSIPIGALTDQSMDSFDLSHDYQMDQPVFPGQGPKMMTLPTVNPDKEQANTSLNTEMATITMDSEKGTESPMTDAPDENSNDEAHSDVSTTYDGIKILQGARAQKSHLENTVIVSIRGDHLVEDVLKAYRQSTDLEKSNIKFHYPDNNDKGRTSQKYDDLDPGFTLVKFWDEAFRLFFKGDDEKVPILDPDFPDDIYLLLGRILAHGLILSNYWPMSFPSACASYILSDSCSDKLLLTSLYKLMKESEKAVLETALDEVKTSGSLSLRTEICMKVFTRSYGCRSIPNAVNIESFILSVAKNVLVYQIFWPLVQIRDGIMRHSEDIFDNIEEDDVLSMYQALFPQLPAIIEKITYLFSNQTEISEKEKAVKACFEQYLFTLNRKELLSLLVKWTGYDCLCKGDLYVKFRGENETHSPVFQTHLSTLILPSTCVYSEDLKPILET
ncbi:hypothetical protein CHS0354_002732 [Potamilus streckersoni]|uniref:Uncharacterized protein n=1 Tax=Potamilus streckersoni TaxID=2493646 RepID=A0AAE0VY28_9BIVA|nr:hypothetical protein CHS0354_002732 [Potamilus streckersoni]